MKTVLDVVNRERSIAGDEATLFVDDVVSIPSDILGKASLGLAPDELWALRRNASVQLQLAVVTANRPARELFRILSLLNDAMKTGAVILLVPEEGESEALDCRAEATEIFCGLHPEWSRNLAEANVVKLVKGRVFDSAIFGKAVLGEPITFPTRSKEFDDDILGKGFGDALRGGKRVTSLAMFGDHRDGDAFWRQMPDFVINYVMAHHEIFPDFELRIHHDEYLYTSNAGDVLLRLQERGLVKLVYMGSNVLAQGKCRAMLWRMAPAWDPEVEFVFCRDVDSLPTRRDRLAVDEFLSEAQQGVVDAHIIHDSPSHALVMGGLCGWKASVWQKQYQTFDQFVYAYGYTSEEWSQHGRDQEWLNAHFHLFRFFQHALHRVVGEGGQTMYPIPAEWPIGHHPAKFALEVQGERDDTDDLINHLGSSGYDLERARHRFPGPRTATPFLSEVAVLSSDLNPDYAFFIPFAVAAWMKLGYRSLLHLVGDPDQWLTSLRHKAAIDRARSLGAEIVWVPEVEGVRTSTMAQVVRIFASGSAHVRGNEYLVTSDIDMLPLGSWVIEHDKEKALNLWYANAYVGSSYVHFPMCYVGAKARVWRELISGTTFADALHTSPKDADGAWNHDEWLLGSFIQRWSLWENVQQIERTFVEGQWRLDRSEWDETWRRAGGSLRGVADAHLPRPGWTDENWARIRSVLVQMFPMNMTWIDEYRELWT